MIPLVLPASLLQELGSPLHLDRHTPAVMLTARSDPLRRGSTTLAGGSLDPDGRSCLLRIVPVSTDGMETVAAYSCAEAARAFCLHLHSKHALCDVDSLEFSYRLEPLRSHTVSRPPKLPYHALIIDMKVTDRNPAAKFLVLFLDDPRTTALPAVYAAFIATLETCALSFE